MREVTHVHWRSSARRAFVGKKYINTFIIYFEYFAIRHSFLGWNRVEPAIWTFHPFCPIEVHCMEKTRGMFSSKTPNSSFLSFNFGMKNFSFFNDRFCEIHLFTYLNCVLTSHSHYSNIEINTHCIIMWRKVCSNIH